MALSKRVRFEILKRDDHACHYCGATAPDVVLHVDHVVPVALGGSDNPDNLVTACQGCNAGKASTSPTEIVVEQVSESNLRWAEAIKKAAEEMAGEIEDRTQRHAWFLEAWDLWDEDRRNLSYNYATIIDNWLASGLPKSVILDCLDISLSRRNVAHDAVFAYMCGIARNKIADLHEKARKLIEESSDGA